MRKRRKKMLAAVEEEAAAAAGFGDESKEAGPRRPSFFCSLIQIDKDWPLMHYLNKYLILGCNENCHG
jgi:hypothetical protein